jgi:chorismate synthase
MVVNMMRFLTAGESHGQQLGVIVEGFPANVRISTGIIDRDLARRQKGYGRGGRMKVESDRAAITAGIRHGMTIGSPILLTITNRDWPRWNKVMAVEDMDGDVDDPEIVGDERLTSVSAQLSIPRPGHADLAGSIKYGMTDLRNILERSSARETATRVAAGALARALLLEFDIFIGSYVQRIGGVGEESIRLPSNTEALHVEESPLRCLCAEMEANMTQAIDEAKERGDSLGGCFVVYATGLPVGLGSYVHWDRRLEGRLAQAVMSIPAIKGVEIGMGFNAAEKPGSGVHDPITFELETGFQRTSNNAGGLEGGMTNGEPLLIRAAMKPIPTLYSPLESVDLAKMEPARAGVERSDVCAVPAAAVVAEAMTAWAIAESLVEKFGGDNIDDMKNAYKLYHERLKNQFRN